jgi:hypothetical protein
VAEDRLSRLVKAYDRANARPHRLSGDPLLPSPGGTAEKASTTTRLICLACRTPLPLFPKPLPTECPRCAGQLVEIG